MHMITDTRMPVEVEAWRQDGIVAVPFLCSRFII